MNSNFNVAFLCEVSLPNYLTDPDSYNYLTGSHSATGYYYWILKNSGLTNVHLVLPGENLDCYDIVVFHYDQRKYIKTNGKYKTIQIVTDRPQLPNVDLYVCCNMSVFNIITNTELVKYTGIGLKYELFGKLAYIHYPMALNYKKCEPTWPPRIYHYTGRYSTLIDDITSTKFIDHMKTHGIQLRFDFDNDHNSGDEDVYFCVRKKVTYYSGQISRNNVDTKYGQKTANRLYQSWKMGTPFITSGHSAMCAIYKSEYDFLIADNLEQFEYQSIKLKNDENLFSNMVKNANIRRDEHTNEIIISQFMSAFDMINV